MKVFNKKVKILIIVLFLLSVSALIYWFLRPQPSAHVLTIYGNIDIRQVLVAFYNTGRILDMHVQEGDRVTKGQMLAELDPIRLHETVAQNKGQVLAQEATLRNAEITLARYENLIKEGAVTQQTLDDAIAAVKVAKHTLETNRAALALAEQQLIDSKLYAPDNGIIQSRILEPGDMVTPQNPVFSLALDNPLWARAYIPETSVGLIQQGSTAWITTDSYPGKRFRGWIGFISPTAEFTPKNVESPDLRTALMYQVRVYACNPTYQLRLGMPVTVEIPLENNPPHAATCEDPIENIP